MKVWLIIYRIRGDALDNVNVMLSKELLIPLDFIIANEILDVILRDYPAELFRKAN